MRGMVFPMIVSSLVLTLLMQAVAEPATRPCIPPHVDQHLIYFASGSTGLDLKQAWQVKIASEYIEHGVSAVTVYSRTDTVGSRSLNLDLSRRRGQAVVNELIRLGVPAGTIVLEAQGETMLPRATPDEAPEPLNRMVHIDYRGGSIPAMTRLRDIYCPGNR